MAEGKAVEELQRRTPVIIGIGAVGTAIIQLGIATSLPLAALLLLTIVGLAQLFYGIVAMRGRIDHVAGLSAFIAPVLLTFALYRLFHAQAPASLSQAVILGSVLSLATALLIAIDMRLTRRAVNHTRSRSAWATLLILAVSAGLVGGITTPALAATSAGKAAAAHGGMAGMGMNMQGHNMDMGGH